MVAENVKKQCKRNYRSVLFCGTRRRGSVDRHWLIWPCFNLTVILKEEAEILAVTLRAAPRDLILIWKFKNPKILILKWEKESLQTRTNSVRSKQHDLKYAHYAHWGLNPELEAECPRPRLVSFLIRAELCSMKHQDPIWYVFPSPSPTVTL